MNVAVLMALAYVAVLYAVLTSPYEPPVGEKETDR